MNSLDNDDPLISRSSMPARIYKLVGAMVLLAIPLVSFDFSSFNQPEAVSSILGVRDYKIETQSNFTTETKTSTEEIPFETKYTQDPSLEMGKEIVEVEGELGQAQTTITYTYFQNELYETETETITLKPAVDRIVRQGTLLVPKTLETPEGNISYLQKLENFWATSYDSTCRGCNTVTATGMKQGYGVVAVDPNVIPLYTKLYIPGYGEAIAGDVGGAVKGNKIDLGYDSLMGQWSARYVDVYILEK